mmetsp:Transcript_26146/g.61306  ORF Transcript_26146/g.61306 Transcript_26146/m.61306 type:complete len:227 (-) Transcript_26146:1047-1727(-)
MLRLIQHPPQLYFGLHGDKANVRYLRRQHLRLCRNFRLRFNLRLRPSCHLRFALLAVEALLAIIVAPRRGGDSTCVSACIYITTSPSVSSAAILGSTTSVPNVVRRNHRHPELAFVQRHARVEVQFMTIVKRSRGDRDGGSPLDPRVQVSRQRLGRRRAHRCFIGESQRRRPCIGLPVRADIAWRERTGAGERRRQRPRERECELLLSASPGYDRDASGGNLRCRN